MYYTLAFRGSLPLPGYDHLGRKVIVIRPGIFDPNKISMEVIQRTSFMVMEIMGAESEQMFISGMILIFDYKGFTMSHVTSMPLTIFKKLRPCWEVSYKLK